MHIRQFLDRSTASLSYLLACPDSRRAVMIDPVQDNLALYLGVLDEMKWELKSVLETHLHVDHITAAGKLRLATGAHIASPDKQVANADRLLHEGDQIIVGKLQINVITTPGAGFGPAGEGYIRLTAFGDADDTREAVERIKRMLDAESRD